MGNDVRDATLPARLDQAETLELLARVGQDITASLAFLDIFAAIERHVGQLLDTATLYIGLIDENREWIDVPLFIDGGEHGLSRRMRVDDPVRPASRCVRERIEILREKTLEEAVRDDIPGTTPTLTALFGPLVVRDRIIGVMSVQSVRARAYGERERLIFRLLSSYAAVALSNAESYRRLAIVEAEKVTALGQLVAGIAHEVNTPVGTALTVATGLERLTAEFRATTESGALKRSDLTAFMDRTGAAAGQLSVNLARASDLVRRFKQVLTDRSHQDRRVFSLRELVGALLTTLPPDIAESPHRIEVDAIADLELDSSHGALAQILNDLVANAVQHGYPDGRAGTIRIEAELASSDIVLIQVADDGVGVADADAPFLFDPFFTARRDRGGAGLGLYIARNLAVATLGGRLTYQPRPGGGAIFRLRIVRRLAD